MSFAAPIIPLAMAVSSAISGVSGLQAAQYQGAVARANAQAAEETAKREVAAANQDMQDRDLAARAEIDSMLSQMSASGLSAKSGSMLMRRAASADLATRDRERLAQKRDINLKNTLQQAETYRAEAQQTDTAGKIGLLSSFLSVPASYLSGSSMVSNYNLGRMSLQSPSYMR